MAQIKIVIDGQVQLSRNLRVFANNLHDLSSFYKEAIEIIKKRTDDVFTAQGSNIEKGSKWDDLSTKTLKAREKRWGYYKKDPVSNAGILTWTGNLRNNVDMKHGKDYGKLTYNAPYAIYHHQGGDHLPKRKILDLSQGTNQAIVKALQKQIHTAIGIFGSQV